MNKTILQVPVNKTVRNQARQAALSLGFSSLQESVRVFLAHLAEGSLEVTFNPSTGRLSPKAAKRYEKMSQDIESGKIKAKTFSSANKLMKHLRS